MVKINLSQCTYFFNPDVFSNDNLINKNKGGLICYLIINLKTNGQSKKYNLNKSNNDHTMTVFLNNVDDVDRFKIPLSVMFFEPDSKLDGIWTMSMSTSSHCNGIKYGTCNMKKYDYHCYGLFFEQTMTNKHKINSIESNFMSGYVFRHCPVIKLSNYINYKSMSYIRYNSHGSLIDCLSIYKLKDLSLLCPLTVFYGYNEYKPFTIRLLNECNIYHINNLTVNGSGHMGHNQFNVTSNLRTYFYHKNKRCLDKCLDCQRCLYPFNDNQITYNLIHGFLKDIDQYFYNDIDNIVFVSRFFKDIFKIDFDLIKDFKGQYLLTKIKNLLKRIDSQFDIQIKLNIDIKSIKNYKDLIHVMDIINDHYMDVV